MRGQMKMFETIAVLMVFFIILAVGIGFYNMYQRASGESQKQEAEDLRGVGIAQIVSYLPELQCSANNIRKTDACVDRLKAEGFQRILGDPAGGAATQAYYFQQFGYSRISIEWIYPDVTLPAPWAPMVTTAGSRTYQLELYMMARTPPTDKTPRRTTRIPIVIFNPPDPARPMDKGRYTFGAIKVEVFR